MRQPRRASVSRTGRFSIESLERRALLSAASLSGDVAGGGDPNDQISEATAVAVGATVEDVIDSGDDVDMYSFTASAGQTLTFDIDVNVDVGNLDSYIRLFDSAGFDFSFNDDDFGPEPEFSPRESFLSHTFTTAGTYYIGVSAFDNSAYNPTTGQFDDGGGSAGGYFLTIDAGGGGDTTPPTVTNVYLDSTQWNDAFRQHMADTGQGSATLGYVVPGGVAQVDELSWRNVNRVHVQFSEDVVVQQGDLAIRGVNVANYDLGPPANFTYDAATFTASWTLGGGAFFANDKILLDLDADAAAGGVTDPAGNALDGDWTNPTETNPPAGGDTFPSGDGAPGGDFRFRLNSLPGDVNRNGGVVNSIDVQQTRIRQFLSPSNPGTPPTTYTAFHDVDGNAFINSLDVQQVRIRQFSQLPAGNPALAAAPGATLFAFNPTPHRAGGVAAALLKDQLR